MMERLAIRDAGEWSSGFERRDSPTPRAKNGTKRSRPRRRCSRSLLLSLPGLYRWSPGVWSVVASAIVVANCVAVVAALQQSPPPPPSPRPMIPTSPRTVGGLPVHRTPLRTKPPGMGMIQQQQQRLPPTTMPYCFSLSSILDLPSRSNFLATQVWPSARVAAKTLEERLCLRLGIDELPPGSNNGSNSNNSNSNANSSSSSSTSDEEDIFTICELGCGPGLPSIAAASAAAAAEASSLASSNRRIRVVATDIDEFGLELVGAAAREQGLDHILSTRRVDLIQAGTDEFWDNENDNNNKNNNKNEAENNTNNNSWIRDVDLFVLSDVFECEAVALGAARLTQRILSCNTNTNHDTDNNNNDDDDDDNTKSGDDTSVRRAPSRRRPRSVWVFAQTDRAQREVYLRELRRLFDETKEDDDADHSSSSLSSSLSSVVLEWSNPESYTLEDPLWLCDVDETLVDYG